MAILFALLSRALPGGSITKGLVFGLIAWFFRIAMGWASQIVMFRIPYAAAIYGLVGGLAEMLILGIFYGVLLKS